jgi:hypothetical protein
MFFNFKFFLGSLKETLNLSFNVVSAFAKTSRLVLMSHWQSKMVEMKHKLCATKFAHLNF